MKRLLMLFLALMLICGSVTALSGCTVREKKAAVVLLSDGTSMSSGNNKSAWEGIRAFAKSHKTTCHYYELPPDVQENSAESIDLIAEKIACAVKNKAEIIVLPGEMFAVATYELAPTYPEVQFVLIGAVPHSQDSDTMQLQANVMCIHFQTMESGFLAGYAAVLKGYRHLGYFGSAKTQTSGDYGGGFAQGAAYAADALQVPVTMEYANYDSPMLDFDYGLQAKPVYKPITQVKEKTYRVEVPDGSGSGVYREGTTVIVTAPAALQGKVFDHWEVKSLTQGIKDNAIQLSDARQAQTELIVSGDCALQACWKDGETAEVEIVNPEGEREQYQVPLPGDFPIKAPPAPAGYSFYQWECVAEDAIDDVFAANTTLSVEKSAIQLVPTYQRAVQPTIALSVEQGSGSGYYGVGDTVELVAEAPPENYIFDKWLLTDNDGNPVDAALDDAFCNSTSFHMMNRYTAVVNKMLEKGVEVLFAGGNSEANAMEEAVKQKEEAAAIGTVPMEEAQEAYALSVINDYGAALQLALNDFKGGNILTANVGNGCIYIDGVGEEKIKQDKNGGETDSKTYSEDCDAVMQALSEGEIALIPIQAGADVRKGVHSKHLQLHYWVK